MHRSLLVLACLLGAVFAQTTGVDPCEATEFSCVGEGSDCTLTANCGRNGNDACPICEDSACLGGLCRALAEKGEDCSASTGPVCTNSDGDDPLVNTCVGPANLCGTSSRPFFAGDPCSDTDELITSPAADGGCIGGTCTSGTCEEVAVNGNCTTGLECAQGTYCAAGLCKAWKTSGNCSSNAECAPNTVCHSPTPTGQTTCTPLFSIAAGSDADCAVTGPVRKLQALASLVCQSGLTCTAGKCEEITDRTGESCDTDANCNEGNPANSWACVTDDCTDTSSCFPLVAWSNDDVVSAYQAFRNCLTSSNCNRDSLPWSSDAGENCAWASCHDEYVDLNDAWGHVDACTGSTFVPVLVLAVAAAFFALF